AELRRGGELHVVIQAAEGQRRARAGERALDGDVHGGQVSLALAEPARVGGRLEEFQRRTPPGKARQDERRPAEAQRGGREDREVGRVVRSGVRVVRVVGRDAVVVQVDALARVGKDRVGRDDVVGGGIPYVNAVAAVEGDQVRSGPEAADDVGGRPGDN